MKVESITITKNLDGTKTIEARIVAETSQTVNVALPTFTNLGMTDKINTGTAKVVTSVERTTKEAVKVEITASHARELVESAHSFLSDDEKLARYERPFDNVTIIRL